MDEPVHWTQVPFDGRPVPGVDPAPRPPAAGPPAPRSNGALIAVIAVVVVAVIGVAVVTHPWSSSPKQAVEAAGDGGDTGGFLDLDEVPSTTVPATADDLARHLLFPSQLAELTREGVAPGTFVAQWVVRDEHATDPDDDLAAAAGKQCNTVTGVQATYERDLVHAPLGTKGEQGDYGSATYVARRFATVAQAQAWVDAHGTQKYLDCAYVNDRQSSIASLGPLVEDGIQATLPVGDGRAHRYHATYTRPDGHPCTEFTDSYYNRVGTIGLASIYDSCGFPMDPVESRALVQRALASLGTLTDSPR